MIDKLGKEREEMSKYPLTFEESYSPEKIKEILQRYAETGVVVEHTYPTVLNNLAKEIHEQNVKAGWWNDPVTGESLLGNANTPYVIATKMLLIMSELSEAVEAYRKDLMDDKLPHRTGVETELADLQIRLFDVCGALKLDIGGAVAEKRKFNSTRSDHKVENRVKKGGKKF